MKTLENKVCEVCGEPAIMAVRDTKEVAPKNGFRQFEMDGPAHFYCEKHERNSEKRTLDYP